MSRIVFATSGSYGDVHPCLAVALRLKQRGHEITIASPEFYRQKVEGEGLRFHPVRPDFVPMTAPPETVRRVFDPYEGASFVIRKLVLPYIQESYDDLLEACRDADLFVIHPLTFAGPLVAEKLQLKWISVALAPCMFVSAWDPPVFPPMPWLNALRRLGPLPHRLILTTAETLTRGWMRPIQEVRKREGLTTEKNVAIHKAMFSPWGTLGWFSPVFASQQPDWPVHTEITGFPVYDKREPGDELDPELAKFLDGGQPPVVFTLGSAAVIDAGNFYAESLEAVRRIGCRAVFLTGDHGSHLISPTDAVFVTAYAPFSEVFPRAAAVVHQGGIGTIAQALKAGVPMLVVPLGLDQPDNAARAARLGVARVLARRRYNAARATVHLRELLTQAKYAASARRIAGQMRPEDGAETACQALERLCGTTRNLMAELVVFRA